MQIYYFYFNTEQQKVEVQKKQNLAVEPQFIWIDCLYEDVAGRSLEWQQEIYQHAQLTINEYHMKAILNLDHSCTFDTLDDYDLLIFRKLITPDDKIRIYHKQEQDHYSRELSLTTTPMSFVLTPQVLITIREQGNQAIDDYIQRLESNLAPNVNKLSIPRNFSKSPLDLCLRLLNAMVEGYLNLRTPLTRRTEYWQNELLQGNSRFTKWHQLLQENMAFQQIENLCEEQIECLQKLKDEIMDNDDHFKTKKHIERQDVFLVRMNDLSSHIERIQKQTVRLRSAIQSAIDLHFSAVANQTNENMRILAILTAVFAPLSLLAGIYGMNFEFIPGAKSPIGFWLMLFIMMLTTIVLIYYFYRRHMVGSGGKSVVDLLAEQQKDQSISILHFLEEDPKHKMCDS